MDACAGLLANGVNETYWDRSSGKILSLYSSPRYTDSHEDWNHMGDKWERAIRFTNVFFVFFSISILVDCILQDVAS